MASENRSGVFAFLVLVVLSAVCVVWLLETYSGNEDDNLLENYGTDGLSQTEASAPETQPPYLSADGSARPSRARASSAAAAAGPSTHTSPSDSMRIEGVITDAQGRVIAGATVALVAPGAVRGTDGRWEQSNSVTTDAEGRFGLEAESAGTHRLLVSSPGRASQEIFADAGAAPMRLVLQEEFRLAGFLRAEDSGEPLPNMSLRASAVRAAETEPGRVVHTDENGQFLFSLPRERAYVIHFPSAVRVYFGSDTGGDWLQTAWGPFADPREDLELTLAQGLAIAGKVQDTSGGRIAETLQVEVLGRTRGGSVDYGRRRFTQTQADGSFRVTGLPKGSYLVTFKPSVAAGATPPSGLAFKEVEGVVAGTEDMIVEIARGEPMFGRIVDDEGTPVLAVGNVYVYPQGSAVGGPRTLHGKLDGEGGFKTPPLDPSTAYDLYVTHFEGYRSVHLHGVRTGAAVVQVTLSRAGLIRGRVLREDGRAAPVGTAVLAQARDAPKDAQGTYGYAYVQPDGHFTLNGLGDFAFRINAGGAGSGLVAAGVVQDVHPGATDVVVQVKRGVALSGRLLDAGGEPVKTHLLTAHPVGAAPSPAGTTSVVDEQGAFRFAGVHAGKLRITAYIGGHYVTVGTVTAPARDVVLQLPEE